MIQPLELTEKELRALDAFRSTDTTRPHLARVWIYQSDGGISHVATDGHGIVVRRAGLHRTMMLHDVEKLAYTAQGHNPADARDRPPSWAHIVKAPWIDGKPACKEHAINLRLLERVARVEAAATDRKVEDLERKPNERAKAFAERRSNARSCFSIWTIPADDDGGWFYKLDTPAALWEGVIMPRRIR